MPESRKEIRNWKRRIRRIMLKHFTKEQLAERDKASRAAEREAAKPWPRERYEEYQDFMRTVARNNNLVWKGGRFLDRDTFLAGGGSYRDL